MVVPIRLSVRRDAEQEAKPDWPSWLFPGWYAAAIAKDIKPGALKPITIAGKELILFRTESGAPAIMDRYCVHQGTSLALGRVQGERLRCAFHHWEYAVDGACVRIPECTKIPPRARIRTYPTTERCGLIWIHVGADRPESGPLPSRSLRAEEGWRLVRVTDMGPVNTTCRDIFENIVDTAHLQPLHQVKSVSPLLEFEGRDDGFWTRFGAYETHGRPIARGGLSVVYAPSIWHTELKGSFMSKWLEHESAWTLALQPIGPAENHCFSAIHVRCDRFEAWQRILGATVEKMWSIGIREDVRMWRNKIVQESPVLCANDGPIMTWRKWWASQEELARNVHQNGQG